MDDKSTKSPVEPKLRGVGHTIQTTKLDFDTNHREINHVKAHITTVGKWSIRGPGLKETLTLGHGEFVLDFSTNSHTLSSLTVNIIDPDPGPKR